MQVLMSTLKMVQAVALVLEAVSMPEHIHALQEVLWRLLKRVLLVVAVLWLGEFTL